MRKDEGKKLISSHLPLISAHLYSRVVILGNGAWENPGSFVELLHGNDFVVACDGAYDKAKRLGLKVDIVIGDFDSLRSAKTDSKVKFLAYPVDKDETDAELAMRYALARKPREILWYGALGARWDHTFANVFLLAQAAQEKIPVQVVQGNWRLFLVLKSCALQGRKGDRVSLIPLSEGVRGIQTAGLRYPLHGENLFRDRTRGISNVMTARGASIQIRSGWLLVLHEKKEMRSHRRNRG